MPMQPDQAGTTHLTLRYSDATHKPPHLWASYSGLPYMTVRSHSYSIQFSSLLTPFDLRISSKRSNASSSVIRITSATLFR